MSVSATLSSSYRHIFFCSPIPSISFFIPIKRTQAYFRCYLYTYTYIYSYLNICVGVRPATLLKRRFQYGCFPVKFAKFLRTSFFTENFWWLLLFKLPYLHLLAYGCLFALACLLAYALACLYRWRNFQFVGGLSPGLSFCGVWALF